MTDIMIVDDEELTRLKLEQQLEAEDFSVVAKATDGSEAIEYYKEYEPSVVTMDISMPEMDGFEALKGILEIDEEASVIMLSSEESENNIQKSRELGAKHFLAKPFEKSDIEVIERVSSSS